MPATDESYPALVERALRLIEERGGQVAADELARVLFGASSGPWGPLLARVLGADGRVARRPDGIWCLVPGGRDERGGEGQPFAAAGSGGRPMGQEAGDDASSGALGAELAHEPSTVQGARSVGPAVGLVVLAAGPKPWRHPIVALGAARLGTNGAIVRFETLVRPPAPCQVPQYLAKLGVDAEELDHAPPLERAIDELLAFVGGASMAGLDLALAVARLQFALRALGRPPLDNELIELAVAAGEKPDLARLARRARIPVPDQLGPGALAALACRLAAAQSDNAADVTDRIATSAPGTVEGTSALDATAWRRLLDARQLASLPDRPGVYLFRRGDGELLYVGKATSLRERLASYLNGSFNLVRRMPGLIEATARLEHEVLTCELAARMREAELIASERPPYNVMRGLEPRLVRARLALDGPVVADGRRVPRLALEIDGRPRPSERDAGRATTRDASEEDVRLPGFDAAPPEHLVQVAWRLTSATAAQDALRQAREGWWPPRPRAGERPVADAVAAHFGEVAAAAAEQMAAAEVAPGLRASALERLIVLAPVRPVAVAKARPDDDDDDGWVRERRDRSWPPRAAWDVWDDEELGGSWPEAETYEDLPNEDWATPSPYPLPEGEEGPVEIEPRSVAIVIDPRGWRVAPVEAQASDDDAEAAAMEGERHHVATSQGGLAALTVVLAALRRGETGVRAWAAEASM